MQIILGCSNSDGMSNFHYSHKGYWEDNSGDFKGDYLGDHTLLSCHEHCNQDSLCFAFTYKYGGGCYHHHDKEDIASGNEKRSSRFQAYVKCYGKSHLSHAGAEH